MKTLETNKTNGNQWNPMKINKDPGKAGWGRSQPPGSQEYRGDMIPARKIGNATRLLYSMASEKSILAVQWVVILTPQ